MRLLKIILALALCLPLTAASLLTLTKTPLEAYNVSVDFTPVVGAGGVSLISVTSTSLTTGFDTTAAIVATAPTPAVTGSSDIVVFRIFGGSHKQSHLVHVLVSNMVTGEIWEGQLTITIE